MKCFLRKTLCVLLTLAMLCGMCVTAFASDVQDRVLTSCGGDCAYCPTILIPGNFQSPTHVLDDDGNVASLITIRDGLYTSFRTRGELIRCILRLVIPLTLTLLLQTDAGLSRAFERVASEILRINGELGLKARELIVDGEDRYSVVSLLRAWEKRSAVFGSVSGTERDAGDLLGDFYESRILEDMRVEGSSIVIPILPYEYHPCKPNDPELKIALYEAYRQLCPY